MTNLFDNLQTEKSICFFNICLTEIICLYKYSFKQSYFYFKIPFNYGFVFLLKLCGFKIFKIFISLYTYFLMLCASFLFVGCTYRHVNMAEEE